MAKKLYVDILESVTDPTDLRVQVLWVRVFWDGKKITFQGRDKGNLGILEIGGKGGGLYTPADGLAYLENLQYNYSGTYLNASAPKPFVE